MIKSPFIADVLDLLLDGAADNADCRAQIALLSDTIYGYTSGGAFVTFSYNDDITAYKSANKNCLLNGVKITSPNADFEAEATVYFRDGIIHNLEISCAQGNYPRRDLTEYTLSYVVDGTTSRQIVKNSFAARS